MKRLLGVTPLIALALVPAAADAGTLTASPSCGSPAPNFFCRTTFTYTASPGEANRVSADIGLGQLSFSDSGANVDYPSSHCRPFEGRFICTSGGEDPLSEVLLVIDAGDGDDEVRTNASVAVTPGPGNDTITNGRVIYSDAPEPVDVDLAAGRATVGDETDTLVGVHEVVGSPFADVLDGSSRDDILSGEAGRDRIRGSGGDDTLDGGAGVDRLSGGAGNDYLAPRDPEGMVAADRVSCGRGTDYVTGLEADNSDADPVDALDATCERVGIFSNYLAVRPRIANGVVTLRYTSGGCDCDARVTVTDVESDRVIASGPAKRASLKLNSRGRKLLARRGAHALRFTWTAVNKTVIGYTTTVVTT